MGSRRRQQGQTGELVAEAFGTVVLPAFGLASVAMAVARVDPGVTLARALRRGREAR